MGTHTPGPWMAEPIYDGEEGCAVIAVHKDLCLSTPTRGQVAWLTTIAGAAFEAPERCEANARLIAAAPELLEALDRVLGTVEHMYHTNPDPDGSLWRDVLACRAAIAKATGSES